MTRYLSRSASMIGLSLALCACGDDGAGGIISYIPNPQPAPDPNPAPPPMPAGAIGLVGGPFSTYSASYDGSGNITASADAVQISYSPDGDVYTVSAPGIAQGQLVDTTVTNGGWTTSKSWDFIRSTSSSVTPGADPSQTGQVSLDWARAPYSVSDLTYTSFGSWFGGDGAGGTFVYGIPTAVGDVPVTGTADYAGEVRGTTSGDGDLVGSIDLQFDFAAGTLGGTMEPYVATNDGWDSASLGTYTFQHAIFSSDHTSFSGDLAVTGSDAASSFHGNFNGPGAVEVMGNFDGPYLSPNTQTWGTMVGVFGARKAP